MEKIGKKEVKIKLFIGNLVLFTVAFAVILAMVLGIKHWKFTSIQSNKVIEFENQGGVVNISVIDQQFTDVQKKLKKAIVERDETAKKLKETEEHLNDLADYYSQCEKNELFKTYAYNNSARLVDLNNDGKDEVISWGSDIFLKPGARIRDLSGIRIYSAKGEDSKLVKVFEKKTMTRSLSVKVADLDCNGIKEVVVRHHNWGSAGYGEDTIIYYGTGAFNDCSTDRISSYPVEYKDINKDGRNEILAYIHFPKGIYHMGEIEVPMLYQWDKNRIVEAPKNVKVFYYNNIFIPKLKREITKLEKENKDCRNTWKSRNIRDIEYRKRAIKVAEDLTKSNFVRDSGWRGPVD